MNPPFFWSRGMKTVACNKGMKTRYENGMKTPENPARLGYVEVDMRQGMKTGYENGMKTGYENRYENGMKTV